jgi:hypothetical protein
VRSFNGETGAHIAMKTRPERLHARAERPARRRFHHLAGGLGAQRKGQRLADLVPAAGHQQIGERDLSGADPDEPLTLGSGISASWTAPGPSSAITRMRASISMRPAPVVRRRV